MADYTCKAIDALPEATSGSSIGSLATSVLAFHEANPEVAVFETSAKRMGTKTRAVLAQHGLGAENRNGKVYVFILAS